MIIHYILLTNLEHGAFHWWCLHYLAHNIFRCPKNFKSGKAKVFEVWSNFKRYSAFFTAGWWALKLLEKFRIVVRDLLQNKSWVWTWFPSPTRRGGKLMITLSIIPRLVKRIEGIKGEGVLGLMFGPRYLWNEQGLFCLDVSVPLSFCCYSDTMI